MGLCGSYLTYLSKPVTEKISTDEANEKIKCGTSSMQGWRESQEDAHNCILDYDTNTSFFAVYDGHGGHEVASYASLKLPQYIKDTEAYKKGKFEEALIDAFLDFDATLTLPEVIDELKRIAGEKKIQRDDGDEDEEDVSSLYEEATMPIEKVIERYTAKLLGAKTKTTKDSCDEKPKENKCPTLIKENCSSSSDPTSNSISTENSTPKTNEANIDEGARKPDSSNLPSVNTVSSTTASNDIVGSSEKSNSTIKIDIDSTQNECSTSNGDHEDETIKSEATAVDGSLLNGEVSQTKNIKHKEEQSEKVGSSTSQENGCMSKKDKDKIAVKEENDKCNIRTRPKREKATKVYNELLNESESDSEDEEDKTFLGSLEEESSSEEEVVNSTIEAEIDEDEEDAEDDDMDNDDDDEEDLEEEEEDEESMEFQKNMKDEPGSGSGCTAVVALLRENQLYVANAGDSRCIVCRSGKAVEMSFDHKPEDQPEEERIKKAGGKVTADGRVNGGLNLSRALGDHAYKQNKELSNREQMITALPDIRTLTIKPEDDEFMVLACDGIWNSLSNQEVVDFVRSRIQKGEKNMSRICEEMFDTCLAPNTKNDGTGCDNMTAIIVQFQSKTNTNKRSAPDDDNVNTESTENIKRVKTEDDKECTSS